ncbi:hypothetical protein GCM10009762_10760 [Dermacoccus barathri]|uniref:Transposase n=2 Tax=Dermacoccus barathri TaxID=322601 RepID=A0ABN2BEE4_9MICO
MGNFSRVKPVPADAMVSRCKRGQRRRDTSPEMSLRRALHARGHRYRVDAPLPGMPHRTPSVALVYAVKYRWLTTDAAAEQIRRALGVTSIDGLLWQTALEVACAIEAPRASAPATA